MAGSVRSCITWATDPRARIAASSCSRARSLACRSFELGIPSSQPPGEKRVGLGLGTLACRPAQERQGAAGADEVRDLLGREDLAMDPHLADPTSSSREPVCRWPTLSGTDGPDRVVQLIGRDVGGLRLAVDVDLHARGLRRAVVGDEDVGPRVQWDLAAGDHLEGILRPLVDQVGRDLVVLDPEVPAPVIVLVVHPRDDRAGEPGSGGS